jgi:hypothetical protein
LLRCGHDPEVAAGRQEDALTEREWQKLENTMRFIVERQAKFETNFAQSEQRFVRGEGRMDRLERFADRAIRAGERRMAAAERRMAVAETEMADLRASLKSFLQAMRRSAGDGKGKP